MSVHALQLKHDRWKYTDLSVLDKQVFSENNSDVEISLAEVNAYRMPHESLLLVMLNGKFMPLLSDLAKLPAGVIVMSMQQARQQHADLVQQYLVGEITSADYPFAAMNLEDEHDGLFLFVPENINTSVPLHLLNITKGCEATRTQTQNMLVFSNNCQMVLLQEYVSQNDVAHFNNIVSSINVGQNSVVQWVKHQHENTLAIHMENYFVRQEQDSGFDITHLSLGAQFSRDDIRASLQAPGAICRTSGFYHTCRDGQYVDHHVDILHQQPHTHSDMLYKGIMDKKSRAVFNGKLTVEQQAQKTNAVQGNHHILLSPLAEAYAKPELEIYADDVKCKHGATTGQIDQDALFYLRARGINEQEARTILLNSFAEDVLQRISHQDMQQHIRQQVML